MKAAGYGKIPAMKWSNRYIYMSLLCFGLGWSTLVSAAPPAKISAALDALQSVHSLVEVALSPDGRTLIYGDTVKGRRGEAEVDASALWIVDARDGSKPRRLTACPGKTCDEHGAAWSPDGGRIVFVTTDESDQPQIAIATLSTLEVKVITRARGPLDTPRWSPDGKRVAFLYSAGAPKTPGPLNPLARDAGVLSEDVFEQRLAVVGADGGDIALLGPADLNVYEYDWSPDGQHFAITAAHGSGDDNWWIAELDVCDARTGAITTLSRPALQMASPRYSGDGTRIAFIGGIMSDESITGGDIYVIPATGGTPEDVTPGLAASVHTITWNGSSRELVATEFAAGEEVLARVDVVKKTQRELWRAPEMIWANTLLDFAPGDSGISLSRNGALSAVIRQSYNAPPEVESGPPGHWHAVTRLNAAVMPITGRARNVHWKSDGFDVQGMLIEPPTVEPGKRYALVVEVHGGPAYAHYPIFPSRPDRFDALEANQGYFVFCPNPRGSYGQGAAFTHANVKDFGYGDLRDILTGVDAVLGQAPIDPQRIGIEGWSYGGYITMWALTQTQRFKAAVAGAGLSNWQSYYGTNNIDTWMLPYFGASVYDDPEIYARSSPMSFIKKVRTPTLIVGGDRDAEVPISQSYEYWNALRRLGVDTQFVVYPDEGHFFFRREDQVDVATRLVDWFNTHLAPGQSP